MKKARGLSTPDKADESKADRPVSRFASALRPYGLNARPERKRGHRLRQEAWERGNGCKQHHGNLSLEPCGCEPRLVELGRQPEASLASVGATQRAKRRQCGINGVASYYRALRGDLAPSSPRSVGTRKGDSVNPVRHEICALARSQKIYDFPADCPCAWHGVCAYLRACPNDKRTSCATATSSAGLKYF